MLFLLGNAVGAVSAYVQGEQMHAEMHLALVLATFVAYLVMRGTPEPPRVDLPPGENSDARMEYLQRPVDAGAFEVERLREAQRLRDEPARREGPPPGDEH